MKELQKVKTVELRKAKIARKSPNRELKDARQKALKEVAKALKVSVYALKTRIHWDDRVTYPTDN